ncbi:MAG: hypothetical protein VB137_10400 [Burkholderia sp.]
MLALDWPAAWLAAEAPKLLLSTGFGDVRRLAPQLKALPVAGIHLDLARAESQLERSTASRPTRCCPAESSTAATADVTTLDRSLAGLAAGREARGERFWIAIATSCSLLHVPVDLCDDTRLDPELKSWLAFAAQKLDEVAVLRDAFVRGPVASRRVSACRRCADHHYRLVPAHGRHPATRTRPSGSARSTGRRCASRSATRSTSSCITGSTCWCMTRLSATT